MADNGNPTLAPYTHPQPGYVQQYNLDVQREVGWGWFLDAAYAGSHGVHLQQYSTNVDQLPDNFVAQAGAECPGTVVTVAAGCTPSIATPVPNTLAGTRMGDLPLQRFLKASLTVRTLSIANLKLAGLWLLRELVQFVPVYSHKAVQEWRIVPCGLHQREVDDQHRHSYQLVGRFDRRSGAGSGLQQSAGPSALCRRKTSRSAW